MNQKLLDWRFVLGLLKDTATDWMEDGALRLAAALAYYSIFSIAPLLVITLGVAGWAGAALGPDVVNNFIYGELGKILGPQSIEMIRSMVESASKPSASKLATVIGAIVLLIGAGGVFGQLKDALNTIWEVKAKSGLGVKGFLRERVLSFGMVLVIGFLLLTTLLLTTFVAAFSGWLGQYLPVPTFLWQWIEGLISFGVVTLLFALIFKVLPDATVDWQHVWIGAGVTAILFVLGKLGLGLYLGRPDTASSYGAAGAVVLILLWIYYASCILFFGAEFTQVYAKAMGHEIRPNQYAEPVTQEMRAQQGLAPSKKEPAIPPPEIITIPVYTPPAAPAFPKTVAEVPGYLRESPAASLVTALVGGFAIGMLSRVSRPVKPLTPTEEIAHGSKALALAAAPLAGKFARQLWSRVPSRKEVRGYARKIVS